MTIVDDVPDEDMVIVPESSPIDLTTWQLWESDDGQNLNKIVMQAVTDILRKAFEDSPPYLHFPFMWAIGDHASNGFGGPPVSDPAMLYVGLPLTQEEGDWCHYACSLEGAVNGLIDTCENPQTGKVDGAEELKVCVRIAGRLREL